jgi:hypothetical protein
VGDGVAMDICDLCRRPAPTKAVHLGSNLGMVVIAFTETVRGHLCGNCIDRVFWRFTLKTLFLGWWGIRSFFRTPYLLISNIVELAGARKLARLRHPDPTPPRRQISDGNRFIRGNDVEETVALTAAEAASGTRRSVRSGNDTVVDVAIPPGVQDGTTLRLLGKGLADPSAEGPIGHLYLILRVRPGGD